MIRDEAAILEVGVHGIHPEIARLLGKFFYDTLKISIIISEPSAVFSTYEAIHS